MAAKVKPSWFFLAHHLLYIHYCKHNLHKACYWSHAGNVSRRSYLLHLKKKIILLYSWEKKRNAKVFLWILIILRHQGGVCVNIYQYIDYLDDIFLLVAGPTASRQSLYILFVFLKRFGCIIVVQGKGAEEY